MVAQAFAYNGVFFTYALVLSQFYGVSPGHIGLYLIPFALGNLLGPWMLGSLFDRLGRRTMIAATYGGSGVLIAFAGMGLAGGWFDATRRRRCGGGRLLRRLGGGQLGVPDRQRALPGRAARNGHRAVLCGRERRRRARAPALFGALLETGSRGLHGHGYYVGAALMIGAGAIAAGLGVAAEGRSLETLNPG